MIYTAVIRPILIYVAFYGEMRKHIIFGAITFSSSTQYYLEMDMQLYLGSGEPGFHL